MISGKQWGFVLKGARKVGRAITGGPAISVKDGAKVYEMSKGLRGAYSASTKHGFKIREGLRGAGRAYRAAEEALGEKGNLARLVAGGVVGSTVTVGGIKAEQKHMDEQRRLKGKKPLSKTQKRIEVVAGVLGGSIVGAAAGAKANKLYAAGKKLAPEIRRGNPRAITTAAGAVLGATSGGIIGHEQVHVSQKKKGLRHAPSELYGLATGAIAGGLLGAKAASSLPTTAKIFRRDTGRALRGDIGAIAKLGTIGLAAGAGGYLGSRQTKTHKRSTAKRVVLGLSTATSGAHTGTNFAVLGSTLGSIYAKQRASKPPSPSMGEKFSAGFKAGATKARNAYGSFMARKFPKKPKALIGMYGGE